jgi:cytochrome c-type biogenesis protein
MSGIGDSFARVVSGGPLLVAVAVAAVAGLVSFLSPCVLPLVPGYLSYVGGLSGTEAASSSGSSSGSLSGPAEGSVAVRTRPIRLRSRTVLGAVLFVLGFTVVFVAYGVLFGRLGALLIEHQRALERILGVVVILLGLAFLGVLPGTSRELRIHRFPSAGLAGAPLLGVVFGLGWTPCIGPTLGAVQSLALSTAGAGRGAVLSAAYCLGLGVPFVLVALGARWLVDALGVVRRHANVVTYVGGGLLVVLGLLLVTGLWGEMTIELTSRVGQSGLGTSL